MGPRANICVTCRLSQASFGGGAAGRGKGVDPLPPSNLIPLPPNPTQANPTRPSTIQLEPIRPNPIYTTKPSPTQSNTTRPSPTQPELTQPHPAQPDLRLTKWRPFGAQAAVPKQDQGARGSIEPRSCLTCKERQRGGQTVTARTDSNRSASIGRPGRHRSNSIIVVC